MTGAYVGPGRRSAGVESWPTQPVRKRRHRVANVVQNQVYKLVFAHLGKFMIIAVYFILLQTMHGQWVHVFGWHLHLPYVKQFWDHLVTAHWPKGAVALIQPSAWKPMRHIVFRGLLEGVLGFVLYNQIGFNVTKYREKIEAKRAAGKDKVRWYNKFVASPYQEHPVTGLQFAFLPILLVGITVMIGLPLYLAVHYGLSQAEHWSWLEPNLASHQSFWQKLYVGDYDGLIIGVFVGFVAGRSYRAYLYDNTIFFARRWIARDRRAHWWMPKPTRDLITDMRSQPAAVSYARERLGQRSRASVVLMLAGLPLCLALAGFGAYVIDVIAK